MHHPIPHRTTPLLAGLLLASSPAWGMQPDDPETDRAIDSAVEPEAQEITQEHTDLSFSSYLRANFFSETDFDTSIGTFKYSAINAGVNARKQLGDAGHLSIGFDAGLINYDINPSPTSIAGDAASIGAGFDDVTTLSLIATYSDRTDDGSSWYIGGGMLSGRERDANFGDSIDGVLTGGYLHKLSNTLELGLGVYARTRLDDDILVVPVPLIKYTIDKRWSITTQGAGLKLNYKESDALTYGLSGEYQSTTFRLDSTHAAAPNAMAIQRGFPIAFYAQYSPNDTIEISGRIGSVVGAELEIIGTTGNTIASQNIETGIFGSIMVSFKF